MKRIALFLLFGLIAVLPVCAETSDSFDTDTLIRTACKKALEIRPQDAEETIRSRVDLRLMDSMNLQERLEYYKKNPSVIRPNLLEVYHKFFLEALKQNDFKSLETLLFLVDSNNLYDNCKEIAEHCVEAGCLEEAKKFIERLEENQFGHKSLAEMEFHEIEFAALCAEKDEHGKVLPKVLQDAFRITARKNNRRHRFLIAELFWGYGDIRDGADVFEQLREAVRLSRNKEDVKAKELFETIFNSIPNNGFPDIWGAVNPSQYLCGIVAVQIEIGKSEWAKELLPKIFIPERDESFQQYTLQLRKNIANLQIAMGDVQAARKTLEGIGEPIHPTIWCDLAVILAKNGDKKGCREIVDKVVESIEKENHPVQLKDDLKALYDALLEINDAKLSDYLIDRILKIDESLKNIPIHQRWNTSDILHVFVVKLMLYEKRFDDALQCLTVSPERMNFDEAVKAYLSVLVDERKFDVAEKYLTKMNRNTNLQVETMQKIARLHHTAGNDEAAFAALQKGLEFTKADRINHGTPVLLIDIAMNGKEFRNKKTERPATEIVIETFQWHRNLISKAKSDAKDFTDEELQHLLLIVGQAYHEPNDNSKIADKKLKDLAESLCPVLIKTVIDVPDGFVAARILQLLDIDASKENKNEIRRLILQLTKKFPDYGSIYNIGYEIMGKIGESEDVPGLLANIQHYQAIVPACGAFEKIAAAEQLPEMEKKFSVIRKEAQTLYKSVTDEYWNREVQPSIDKAFTAICQRK